MLQNTKEWGYALHFEGESQYNPSPFWDPAPRNTLRLIDFPMVDTPFLLQQRYITSVNFV